MSATAAVKEEVLDDDAPDSVMSPELGGVDADASEVEAKLSALRAFTEYTNPLRCIEVIHSAMKAFNYQAFMQMSEDERQLISKIADCAFSAVPIGREALLSEEEVNIGLYIVELRTLLLKAKIEKDAEGKLTSSDYAYGMEAMRETAKALGLKPSV